MPFEIDIAPHAPLAAERLSAAVVRAVTTLGAPGRPVVFACLGTDRSTGDALGPLVGQRLLELGVDEHQVVGTLERPLHALNLAERLADLAARHPAPLVVAVDAAVGPAAAVGGLAVRLGGVLPGHGVGKRLPVVGRLAVLGVVGPVAGRETSRALQGARLFVVQNMALTIADACWAATCARAGAAAAAIAA